MKLYKPDAEDFHVYGGVVLVGVGVSLMLWGLAIAGGMLWYMGTFRANTNQET